MLKPRKFEVRKGPPPEPIKKSNSSSQINGQPRSKSGTPRSSNSQNQPSHQRPTTNSPARAAALVGRKPQSSSLRASSSTPTSGKRGRADLDIPRDRKKSRTATPTRVPSDSSSENEGDDGDDFMRVFQTVGGNRNDSPQVVDRKRRLWLGLDDTLENGTIKSETDSATSDPKKIIHGKHLTSTDHEHQYLPLFPDTTGRAIAELQYPGSLNSRERFELVRPSDPSEYAPVDDMVATVEQVLHSYLPKDKSAPLLDDGSGIPRRLKRAIYHRSLSDFQSVLDEFNTLIREAIADDTIRHHLESIHSLPLSLVERILSQVYSRTVSPNVRSLARYENGGDNVYGELLPRLVHTIIFQHAAPLDSGSTFIDLGSGVGNVVLQAALETGCDSWGIEQMENPAKLAKAQVREFRARCALWRLRPGHVHLVHGDFTTSVEIDSALHHADVVLVNNQAFQPQLNDKLVMRFLDLKDGARVVSLKRLGPPPKYQSHNQGDPKNILRKATKYEYGSGCVSWTDKGGEYIVAIKQPMQQ